MSSPTDQIRELRWRCRTDLLFLSKILGYDQLTENTHRPVIDAFQKFPVPTPEQYVRNDVFDGGKWSYTPILPLEELPGARRTILLDSRGFAKSTINLICHSAQWIINYPNITLLLVQANLKKIQMVVGELKSHFQYNEAFRALFPEHCPVDKVDDWGRMESFTTEARTDWKRKEPAVLGISLETGVAGMHFHVMKFSDIVEQDNSENPEQIQKVISRFQMFRNLLDRPDYWIDVEGTRYHGSDLYGEILNSNKEREKRGQKPEWKVFVRGCYKKDISTLDDGLRTSPKYTPDELECPDLLDARGLPISNWPEKFSVEFLEAERTDPVSPDSELIFATQRKNNPWDVKGVKQIFAVSKFHWISRENFRKVPIAYRQITVDTASTQKLRSNYSAITTGAWSAEGKLYIEDVIHGKFLPEEIIFHLFNAFKRYQGRYDSPRIVFIEKTAYVDGLMPSINRAQDTGKLYIPETLREKYGKEYDVGNIRLPIELLPRETTISKQDRIRLALQVPYTTGDLVFLDDITCLDYLKEEFFKFPEARTDDIIDTVADQYQMKEYFGRLKARPQTVNEYLTNLRNKEVFAEDILDNVQSGATHHIPSPYDTSRWGNL